jgi:hypothetical protein
VFHLLLTDAASQCTVNTRGTTVPGDWLCALPRVTLEATSNLNHRQADPLCWRHSVTPLTARRAQERRREGSRGHRQLKRVGTRCGEAHRPTLTSPAHQPHGVRVRVYVGGEADNPFHRSEAEAQAAAAAAAAGKRRPPSASRKPPPVPASEKEREIAAAQRQLEGEIRSQEPDAELREAIRGELAKMGITRVPEAMLDEEVKRIKREQGGKPKTPEVRACVRCCVGV